MFLVSKMWPSFIDYGMVNMELIQEGPGVEKDRNP